MMPNYIQQVQLDKPLAGGGLGGLGTIIPSFAIPMAIGTCLMRIGAGRIGTAMRTGWTILGTPTVGLCSSRFDYCHPGFPKPGWFWFPFALLNFGFF